MFSYLCPCPLFGLKVFEIVHLYNVILTVFRITKVLYVSVNTMHNVLKNAQSFNVYV